MPSFKRGQRVRIKGSGTIWDGVEGTVVYHMPSDKWPVYVSFDGAGNGFTEEEVEVIDEV